METTCEKNTEEEPRSTVGAEHDEDEYEESGAESEEWVNKEEESEDSDEHSPADNDNTMETDDAVPSSGWTSKSGLEWSPTDADTMRYIAPPIKATGPTRYAIDRITNLEDSFELMVTPEIVKHITEMTNLHGRRTVKNWTDTDTTEIKAYIGLLILAGVYRSRNESTVNLWRDGTGRPIFTATMAHKRFSQLSTVIRFDDKQTRQACLVRQPDKLVAIRVIWDKWLRQLESVFIPDREITIDEKVILFRGRCPFQQAMLKKPFRSGLKIWVLCDAQTSFACRMQVHTGKTPDGAPKTSQGKQVVLELTEGMKGNTVTCNNVYTSYSLAEDLLRRKITLVGHIHNSKPELPPALLQTRGRVINSAVFAFRKKATLVSYIGMPRKNIILLSTKHRKPEVTSGKSRKPQMVVDYNRWKKGVDVLNQLVATYSCRQRTRRWPMALFHHIIDVSAVNASILWTAAQPNWKQGNLTRRRLFLEELGRALTFPLMATRQRLPHQPGAAAMVTQAQDLAPVTPSCKSLKDTRRQCKYCPVKKRRMVTTICQKCDNYTCKEHTTVICNTCAPSVWSRLSHTHTHTHSASVPVCSK
ncbi:piggyBac transposable element-derived protein 4-like [Epinephelus moara]|uniref:piggyBac transposable element-derived protein 4-like n=1 Tax=Epinephelus moara TaxID=300413 RepID=UPI00214EC22C|nr:piggyBac transposable element-derived protein 4-like [Epinephelus moara]